MTSGSLNLLEPSGPVQACNGIALPLPSPKHHHQLWNHPLDTEGSFPGLNRQKRVADHVEFKYECRSIPDPSVYLHGFHNQHTSTALCLWEGLQEQLDGAHSRSGSFV